MNVANRILLITIGRSSDPLLAQVIATEDYDVIHASSLNEALEIDSAEAYGALVLMVGERASAEFWPLLKEAAATLPAAKLLVVLPSSEMAPQTDTDVEFSGRLQWVYGDATASQNIAKIRRFLRGDGYQWASDLRDQPNGASLLDATGHTGQQEETRYIARFAADLAKFNELQPMLQEALSRFMEILRCDAGSIYLWDEQSDTLILEAAQGPEMNKRLGLRQKLGEGLAGWVAEVGESILVTDSRKVKILRARQCRRYSNFSCLAVPFKHGGQLFGVACLTMPRRNSFEPQDLRLAEALCEKLAAVIRPMSVLSELKRFSERMLGAFKSSSELVLEKDSQVAALRALSSNILESIPMAVIAYDRELCVRSANRQAGTMFGIQQDNVSRSSYAPLEEGLEMNHALWRNKLLNVIMTSRKFRLIRVGYRSDVNRWMLDIHCSPLNDSTGLTIGGILTVQDVTEDVEMEAKLSAAERLALIGKLAAKVAHELNNPLDGILRFLNLAIRQLNQPNQAKAYLEESRNGLMRMGNILTQLLAFSRSHYVAQRPTSLSQIIHQGLAPYEQRARTSNIRIELDVPPDLPVVPSNEVWEVLGNVVKNALDAMGQNGLLSIRAMTENLTAKVIISDSGPGIPDELYDKIFEPFFTTKKDGTGTGLGLAVCRDSLRRIGGEIKILPSKTGACFEVSIPIKEQRE